MELKLKDIFSTIIDYDAYCEYITEEIKKDAYKDLKLYADDWWHIMSGPVETKELIYGLYFSINPYYIENIYNNFLKYDGDFLYYDISDIIDVYMDIGFDSFNICDWAGEDWTFDITNNHTIKILYSMFIEVPDKLKAVDYVNLIAFLVKNYPKLIDDTMNINNIIDKICSFLQSNYHNNDEDKFVFLSKLLKNNLFSLNTTHTNNKKVNDLFNLIKNIDENNVKSIVEEIEEEIENNSQVPSYTDEIFTSHWEDWDSQFVLKVPLSDSEKKDYTPLGYEKDLFGNKTNNQKIKNKYFEDIAKYLENSPEDIYKREILDPYNKNETIFLKDNPYLEVLFK